MVLEESTSDLPALYLLLNFALLCCIPWLPQELIRQEKMAARNKMFQYDRDNKAMPPGSRKPGVKLPAINPAGQSKTWKMNSSS
jgi:hypothetical protein